MTLDSGLTDEVAGLVERALAEDIGDGDITTELVLSEPKFVRASILAREGGTAAGMEIAEAVFRKVDDTLKIEPVIEDGETFEESTIMMRMEGNGSSILQGERTALNFLGRLSGIATISRRFVEKVEGTGAVILDTRKTTPTLRKLEKYAVSMGGGGNHRMGLYDQILIKENHAKWAGGLEKAVRNVMGAIGREREMIQVVVEASDLEQVKAAMVRGVNRILLDNMTVEMVREARKNVPGSWALEVSGGVNLDNVRQYAEAGADFISIGALTHSPRSVDFTLLFE